jgi:hypothetical protein
MSDFGVMGLGVGCVENGTVTRMVNETKKNSPEAAAYGYPDGSSVFPFNPL